MPGHELWYGEPTTGHARMVSAMPVASQPNVLREDIERLWGVHYDHPLRVNQLDALEEIGSYVLALVRKEGPRVHRTIPQMVSGLGWPDMGGVHANRQRYRNSIVRRLDVLQEIGWLEGRLALYDDRGEGTGILITASPAGVAQSVGAAAAGRRSCEGRSRRRSSLSRPLSSPCGNQPRKSSSACGLRGRADVRARAHEALERRSRCRGAALESLRARAAARGGSEALRRAGAAGEDPLVVALVAWEQCTGRHPHLTAKRRMHLQRYCEIADRLGGPGVGSWWLVRDVELHAERVASGEIVTLDYFVCRLRREVRLARRKARQARRAANVEASVRGLLDQLRSCT